MMISPPRQIITVRSKRGSKSSNVAKKVLSVILVLATIFQLAFLRNLQQLMSVTNSKETKKQNQANHGEKGPSMSMKTSQSGIIFQRYEKVAIVSKVHHPVDIFHLKKMLCLCGAAYNRYVNYDVVIFITMPFTDKDVEDIREVVAPANLIVARDGPSLEDQLATMDDEAIEDLRERCGVLKPYQNLTWYDYCQEEGGARSNLAYAWQSEFRAYHIYHHPALLKYKYMIWLDSDVQCVKPWDVDPMKVMIESDLVILFHQFPAGQSKNNLIKEKMQKAYNRVACGIKYDKHLKPSFCRNPEENVFLSQILGFHHITNLDFYRNETQQTLLKSMVGERRFSRLWDDQIAVTLPAALGAPEKAWMYQDHGLENITLLHKGKVPEARGKGKGILKKYWFEDGGRDLFPEGKKCEPYFFQRELIS